MKTFTVAGVSTEAGTVKFRVANDLKSRATMLARCGNTDIQLVELPTEMTREQAAQHLLSQPFVTEAVRELLTATANQVPVERKPVTGTVRVIKQKPKSTVAVDDDGFVEPTDERIQVAMCRLARAYPGLSARHLYEQVLLTHKEFGDYEPNF